MDLDEVQERLTRFARAHLDDPAAAAVDVEPGPGHAGFSYLFAFLSRGARRELFMRLPPPGVKWEGTADVLRQVAALHAIDDTDVPHAPVLWSGDDLDWFECPYFIQPRIDGDVLRGDYVLGFTVEQRREMARQAMTALAGIHRVDPARAPYLGEFWGFEFDVTRWDRFYERAAEPERLARQPAVRQKLLDRIPHDARIAIYHGDFQWANLMYGPDARLRAVIDWELCGIGAILNDVGWICAFNEPRAWAPPNPLATGKAVMPLADELEAMYREAWGAAIGDLRWFKALALYKFSIISGFNLMLHRRGKRHDPHWEEMIDGMQRNMEHADEILSE